MPLASLTSGSMIRSWNNGAYRVGVGLGGGVSHIDIAGCFCHQLTALEMAVKVNRRLLRTRL